MTGGDVSVTVTVNEQLALFWRSSVATQVTVVMPAENSVPDGGVHTTLTMRPHLVLAVIAKFIGVPFVPAHAATILDGQLMVTQGAVTWARRASAGGSASKATAIRSKFGSFMV